MLQQIVEKVGKKDWIQVSETLLAEHKLSRTPKQCRERFHNHLNPEVLKNEMT